MANLSSLIYRFGRTISLGLGWAWFIYCVAGIELLIRKNHITDVFDVTTSGQLIPLMIGTMTIIQIFVDRSRNEYQIPPLIWDFMVRYFCISVQCNTYLERREFFG
jgi:hypothetical protein